MPDFERGEALEAGTDLGSLKRSLFDSTNDCVIPGCFSAGGAQVEVWVVNMRRPLHRVMFPENGLNPMGGYRVWPQLTFLATLIAVDGGGSGYQHTTLLEIRIRTDANGQFDSGTVKVASDSDVVYINSR